MDLALIWYALIGVLLIGYAVLDGFDLGSGMLHLFVAKTDDERRTVLASIGPVWDGNEVWLLTAGGALFAAFPLVYATAFSGFYLALVLVLLSLIARAVSLEVRSKEPNATWRGTFDVVFAVASFLPSLLFGVAMGNVLRGIPIDNDGVYRGGLFGLLDPFTLVVGVTAVALFAMQGGAWLAVKTEGALQRRARSAARWSAIVLFVAWLAATALARFSAARIFELALAPASWIVPLLFPVAVLLFLRSSLDVRDRLAFASSTVAVVALLAIVGFALYPEILPATDAARSLTVTNASSSERTLSTMLVVALIGMPLVLAYTAWIYATFRGKVRLTSEGY